MDRDDWRLRRVHFEWLQQQLGMTYTIDRMATRANTRVANAFCSVCDIDPDSEGRSAFLTDWTQQRLMRSSNNYCFPPFSLIGRVLQHVRECKAWATVIVPDWPSQFWWPELMAMQISVLVLSGGGEAVFERIVDGDWQPVLQQPFRALAVTVYPTAKYRAVHTQDE